MVHTKNDTSSLLRDFSKHPTIGSVRVLEGTSSGLFPSVNTSPEAVTGRDALEEQIGSPGMALVASTGSETATERGVDDGGTGGRTGGSVA